MRDNRNFVKQRLFSRATNSARFTIRQWFSFRRPGLQLLGFLVVVALLVFFGPFGTWAILAVTDRFAFWAATVGVNWIVLHVVVAITIQVFDARSWPLRIGLLLAGAVAAVPGTAVVWLAVAAFMDHRPTDAFGVISLYSQVLVLNLIIGSAVCFLVRRARRIRSSSDAESLAPDREADETTPDAAPAPALLERLPAASRAELLHLRMQDHYVEVHTAVGMELLLMRFRDALREVENVNGLRVHRSHWVARAAVIGVERRRGGSLALRLVNGSEVPVSRSFAPVLKDQGWI